MSFLKRYGIISLGCLIFGIGFALFLKPAEIAPGGVSGIAILISHFYPKVDSGIVILLLNVPLLVAGAVILGWKFLAGTMWATLFSSACISVTESIVPVAPTTDPFCCALLGALCLGGGLGLVFRENATTGGTDIAVKLIQKKIPHLKSGTVFIIFDSIIVVLSGIVFGDIQIATYSGLSLVLSMLLLNYLLYGGMRAKMIIVIDKDVDALAKVLIKETGVTVLSGRGAYSNTSMGILLCAVDKRKFPMILRIISQESPDSIVITTPAEGFSRGRSVV